MSVLRQLKKAVQWHDGMLLRPEHFQQADRRGEQLRHFQLSKVLPYYWGVSHLKIDEVLLSAGTLRILEMDAIMPDGMIIGINAEDGDHLELELSDYADHFKKSKSLLVYLAIPEHRSDAASVTSEFPRYESVESGFVINQNTGEEAPRFACLKPYLKLFAGEEPSGRFVFFPLIKIDQEKANYDISDFTAPALHVPLTSKLGSLCTHTVKNIRTKASFLSEQIRNDKRSIMAQESQLHIKTMMAGLIGFEALVQTGKTHPFNLYVGLSNLAGHLSALRPNEIPPAFEPYDHDDALASFREVLDYIAYCLNALQEGFSIVPFAKDDRVFKVDLERSWMAEKLIIGVKGSVHMQEKDLIEWITSAVIATKDFVEGVRDKRILGASRSLISGSKELRLMPSRDMILLEIVYDHSFINPDEEFQIFNVADTALKRPTEVVLYVPRQTEKQQ